MSQVTASARLAPPGTAPAHHPPSSASYLRVGRRPAPRAPPRRRPNRRPGVARRRYRPRAARSRVTEQSGIRGIQNGAEGGAACGQAAGRPDQLGEAAHRARSPTARQAWMPTRTVASMAHRKLLWRDPRSREALPSEKFRAWLQHAHPLPTCKPQDQRRTEASRARFRASGWSRI